MTLADAFEQIAAWMRAHDAGVLADNLADGATDAQLAELEAAYGVPLPEALRALWSLHDGQRDECNGFYEWRDLLSIRQGLAERDVLDIHLEFSRRSKDEALERGVTAEELESDAWIAIAGRDSDLIAVHALTGRVFECAHDDPPPKLLAGSIVEWLTAYATRVLADDYRVEEGFGDVYLERRNRAAEAQELEREQKAAARAHALRTAPIAELVAAAVSANRPDQLVEALDAVSTRSERALGEATKLLFESGASPSFIASALRTRLGDLSLGAAEWKTIAEGGEQLGNNAIVARAREHLGPKAPSSTPKPWWKIWS